MFTFTCDGESYMNSVTCDGESEYAALRFKNEMIEIECSPANYQDLFDNGYESDPRDGEFRFYYDNENITFTSGKYGEYKAGCLTLTLKMTKEIRESLEDAMNEWRAFILERKETCNK